MTQIAPVFALRGGLDYVTPAMLIPPGRLIGGENYEADIGGYRRFPGFERFNGRPAPSRAEYSVMTFAGGSALIPSGTPVTASSGGAAVALQMLVETGDLVAGTGAGRLVLGEITGAWSLGADVQVALVAVAEVLSSPVQGASEDNAEDRSFRAIAQNQRRALIAPVPGSGPVRGAAILAGVTYAWRDNAGATACIMHRSTPTGWVAETFGHTVDFTLGTARFEENEIVTAGGGTGIVRRVVKQSGGWNEGTAAGYLVLSAVTGTMVAGPMTSAGGAATSSGAQQAITLPPGGKYRTIEHNFYGASNLRRLYGVNGVGPAFEWDGAVLAPIRSSVEAQNDRPTTIEEFSEHLFLGFRGGAVICSGTGNPLSYEAIDGAVLFGVGADVTGLGKTLTALVVVCIDRVSYLSGSDETTFQMLPVSEASGGKEDTFQIIGAPMFLDNLGVRDLQATQRFGDWRLGAASALVEPLLSAKTASGLVAVASQRVRTRDIYRLVFSDGSGISIYIGRGAPECMAFRLPFVPHVMTSGMDASGREVLLAGDTASGMVYQMDSGTSFDGAPASAFVRMAFFNAGSPNMEKRWHRTFIEIDTQEQATFAVAVDFGYGDPDLPSSGEAQFEAYGGGGFWDIANWDQFQWSSPIMGMIPADLDGLSPNCSVTVMSDHTVEQSHILSTVTMHYSQRRNLR